VGCRLRVPVVDLIEIGAGGGSIVRIDELGLIKVGPDSVGADPGPACYGRGGELATVPPPTPIWCLVIWTPVRF